MPCGAEYDMVVAFSDSRDNTRNGLVTDLPDSRRVNGQRSWLFMKISSHVGSVNCDVLAKCPSGHCAIFGKDAGLQPRKEDFNMSSLDIVIDISVGHGRRMLSGILGPCFIYLLEVFYRNSRADEAELSIKVL